MSKELFKIEILVCEESMQLKVIGFDGYKPNVYEIIGTLEMQKTLYNINTSTDRIDKYIKTVKKLIKTQTK